MNITLNLQATGASLWDLPWRDTLFVVEVSINGAGATNRNWQTKVLDTRKVAQLDLPRQKSDNTGMCQLCMLPLDIHLRVICPSCWRTGRQQGLAMPSSSVWEKLVCCPSAGHVSPIDTLRGCPLNWAIFNFVRKMSPWPWNVWISNAWDHGRLKLVPRQRRPTGWESWECQAETTFGATWSQPWKHLPCSGLDCGWRGHVRMTAHFISFSVARSTTSCHVWA